MNLGSDLKILVFESIGDIELIKNNPNLEIAINDFNELKDLIKLEFHLIECSLK